MSHNKIYNLDIKKYLFIKNNRLLNLFIYKNNKKTILILFKIQNS